MRLRLLLATCAFALGLQAGAAAPVPDAAPFDTLERPARSSALAPVSLLVAGARAGRRIAVAGERGHVLTSDDDGATWSQAQVPVSVTMTALCFADERNGWAVGHRGAILKTDDGGRTWQRQLDGRAVNRLVADAVASDASLPREAARFAQDGADKPWLAVACVDARRAVVVGAFGLGVTTADGGRTWSLLATLLRESGLKHVNALVAYRHGFVLVGEQGLLLRTSTDAAAVHRLDTPYAGSFFDVIATAAGDLLALGLRGHLYRSSDDGATWAREEVPSSQTLAVGLACHDGPVLLADETGALFRSTDGRAPFARLPTPAAFPLAALVEAADGRVIAAGTRGARRLEHACGGGS